MSAELLPLPCPTCGENGRATGKSDDAGMLCECECSAAYETVFHDLKPLETVLLTPNAEHPRLTWCSKCGHATRHFYQPGKMPNLKCLECVE
jgi:hypothetical protein